MILSSSNVLLVFVIIFNILGRISSKVTIQRNSKSSENGHLAYQARSTSSKSTYPPRYLQQSSSDSLFSSISPDHWYMYPDAVNHENYQSQINYGGSDLQYHQHQSLVEGFEPLEENLESFDNQPDDLPSGEIKYSDDIALDGEENLEDNEGEIVLSNFHKTIDNSGNTWNYGDQYPVSDFRCSNKIYAGYYADVQSDCQIWHLCEPNGRHHSFSCPNGTLFNQLYRVCDWWYNVDCPKSREYYHINRDQGLINHNNKDYRNQQPNDYSQSFNDQNGNNQLLLGSKTSDSDDY